MSNKTIILFILVLNCIYSYQENIVLKWVSEQKLPTSSNSLIMVKNLSQNEDPNLCMWFKGTEKRLLDDNDFDSNGSFIKGTNLDPKQCSLSLKSYNKDTHEELDYYKPFMVTQNNIDYGGLPKDFEEHSNFADKLPDLVYALAYFDGKDFKLDQETTEKSNERKFMCHAKLLVKAHRFRPEFTNQVKKRLQDRVHFEIEETLVDNQKEMITSQLSKNSTSKFINTITKPRTSRSANNLIAYQIGENKTVYLSDPRTMVNFCCTLKILNEDNSIFFEEKTSCINAGNGEMKPENGEKVLKLNFFLLLSTVVISILYCTSNRLF